jgi:hypothetical protein
MNSSNSNAAGTIRAAAAARKRLERERMRAEGYVLRQIWVRPTDWARVQKYLLRLNKGRAGGPTSPT